MLQAALKDILDTGIVNSSGDLFLYRQQESIPIYLADFKEIAARIFKTGKKNPFYQAVIARLFQPYGRKTPETVIYVYSLGEYYKLATLTLTKEEVVTFQKERDLTELSLSDVFVHLYLYYVIAGKVN